MILHWPQVTMLFLIAVECAYALFKDGQPRTTKHSFCGSAFVYAFIAAVLYFGGFWTGGPQ